MDEPTNTTATEQAAQESRSVQPECTKTLEMAGKGGEREPYKQEVDGSIPSPPTNKSITYAPDRAPENTRIRALAVDFVHLLCTTGLHGTLTLFPAPKVGVCQVCEGHISIRPGMPGHEFGAEGRLVRARCPEHEAAGDPLHAITVQFPEAKPHQAGKQANPDRLPEPATPCS